MAGSRGRRVRDFGGSGGWRSVGPVGGAIGAAAIFVLSGWASAGTTPGALFPGAHWTGATSYWNNGCSRVHDHRPTWSATTGNGTLRGGTRANTCPPVRGGNSVNSYGILSQEISVVAPVTLASGTGGVNVTWDLRVFGNQSSGFRTAGYTCPGTPYSYTYTNSSGTVTYSGVYYSCFEGAEIDVWMFASLVDSTNGTTFSASNSWNGLTSTSYTENLTNMTVWNNPSTWTTFNGSVGAPGKISGHYRPQLFINGTFNAKHTYAVETFVITSQISEVIGFATGRAFDRTMVDMGGKAGHADLLPFSIW